MRYLFPLIHFDVWGFAAKTASAYHIDGKLRRAAVAWSAFHTAFLTLTRIHADVLFDYTKNKLRLELEVSSFIFSLTRLADPFELNALKNTRLSAYTRASIALSVSSSTL